MIYCTELEYCNVISDSGFELVTVKQFWTSLFSQYFLDGSCSPDDSRDDMLFYVRKTADMKSKQKFLQVNVEFKYIVISTYKLKKYIYYTDFTLWHAL